MKNLITTAFVMLFLSQCTYDSTPPGSDRINDAKQLLSIDATGLTPQRAVRIQYTDSLGSTTLQTSAEKTDASGRLLYPLYLTRGTRNYSVKIDVDGGAGTFASGMTFTQNASFTTDGESKDLKITNVNFTAF
jgi:hypothetical protein